MASNVIHGRFRKSEEAKANVQNMADEAIDFLNRHHAATEAEVAQRVRQLEDAATETLEKIFRMTATRYAAYSKGRDIVREALDRIYKS